MNRGTGFVHELAYDERQPVPSVHLQHFDIVPRLMPVMRESDKIGHIVDRLTFEAVLEEMLYALILLVEIIDIA